MSLAIDYQPFLIIIKRKNRKRELFVRGRKSAAMWHKRVLQKWTDSNLYKNNFREVCTKVYQNQQWMMKAMIYEPETILKRIDQKAHPSTFSCNSLHNNRWSDADYNWLCRLFYGASLEILVERSIILHHPRTAYHRFGFSPRPEYSTNLQMLFYWCRNVLFLICEMSTTVTHRGEYSSRSLHAEHVLSELRILRRTETGPLNRSSNYRFIIKHLHCRMYPVDNDWYVIAC